MNGNDQNSEEQALLKRQLLLALCQRDYNTADRLLGEGADPHHDSNIILLDLAEATVLDDTHKREAFAFLFSKCDDLVSTAKARTVFNLLLRQKSFEALKTFLNAGFDINQQSYLGDGSLLTSAILNEKSSFIPFDEVKFMLENGADARADNQRGLARCLIDSRYPMAKLLIDHGADLNAGNGDFFYGCVSEVVESLKARKISEPQAERIITFMLDHGASPMAGEARALSLLNAPDDKQAYTFYEMLQNRVEKSLRMELYLEKDFFVNQDVSSLRKEFKCCSIKDTGLSLAARSNRFDEVLKIAFNTAGSCRLTTEDYLRKNEEGYRVIDYLAARGKLGLVFHPQIWKGREAEGIALEARLLPQYRSEDAALPLKLERSRRKTSLPRR